MAGRAGLPAGLLDRIRKVNGGRSMPPRWKKLHERGFVILHLLAQGLSGMPRQPRPTLAKMRNPFTPARVATNVASGG